MILRIYYLAQAIGRRNSTPTTPIHAQNRPSQWPADLMFALVGDGLGSESEVQTDSSALNLRAPRLPRRSPWLGSACRRSVSRSVLGDDRSRGRPVEVIVHANAHDIELRMEVLALGPAEGAGRSVAGEIDIEIFDLGRPMRGEQPLDAAAGGPAGAGVVKAKGVHLPIGEARRAVDQEGRREELADAAAHGAEPRQADVGAGDGSNRGQVVVVDRVVVEGREERQRGVVAAAAEAGALEVGLGANQELIELEVVADLSAANDAALVADRIAVGEEEQVVGIRRDSRWAVAPIAYRGS